MVFNDEVDDDGVAADEVSNNDGVAVATDKDGD